jgi:NADP-dependent 3-hydroxy acid dehydrogenase YdfG
MSTKVWFISGTSKGFGKIWAKAAMDRGDKVAGTARTMSDVDDLKSEYGDLFLPLHLDVNNRDECFESVKKAKEEFGQIDILINNAGYGHFGAIEELSEKDARHQIETNVFGSLWLAQAVLPYMREQKNGHIMQVSSVGGVVAFPGIGAYHMSKWAVEAMCESLSKEVKDWDIHVSIIEPGGYSTDWSTDSAVWSENMKEYDFIREKMKESAGKMPSGDPEATDQAILKLADAENPPLRLILGTQPLGIIKPTYEKRLNEWEEWNDVAEAAQAKDEVEA